MRKGISIVILVVLVVLNIILGILLNSPFNYFAAGFCAMGIVPVASK